jgi:Na+-exporting ATPase
LPGRGNPQKKLSQPAHSLSWKDVVQELGSDGHEGLSHSEATERATTIGKNEVEEDNGVNVFEILGGQVANAMTLVSVQQYRS